MKIEPGRSRRANCSAPATPDLDSFNVDRSLASLSADALRGLSFAGSEVAECMRILAKTGHNIVGELLHNAGDFVEWRHIPESDAYDPGTHSQFYYHAHAQSSVRPFAEHGHFHLFMRKPGMPRGVGPAPHQSAVSGDGALLSHLIAISMDARGIPQRLFTTNRWVTGDTWYDAADVIAMLDSFDMDVARPNWLVNRWVTAMVRLFRPQIVALLRKRDAVVEAWSSANRGIDIFEHRRLEITSMYEIDVDRQLAAISEARKGVKTLRQLARPATAPGHC